QGVRKHTREGRFFTRDYPHIIQTAANVACSGVTNYQAALKEGLTELSRQQTRNRHILLLTDGEPTQGDWLVREERRVARHMKVAIHTLFIGTGQCPEILDVLSRETGGGGFAAQPASPDTLVIQKRG
ncbi:MAG: VWA domain-containing protein, partial [Deltaproteobacteria bacterium]|nr:VWA domain-containing protein [Deltaproteobacteria bacterium]